MQRFAGLNSIEGWNLTLQLSHAGITKWTKKKLLTSLDGYGILLKLSREELLRNSKKNKKVVDKHETL